MNNEFIVCHTCLSTDRTLFATKTLQNLLLNVDLNDLILDLEGAVCWECKSIIVKFSRFKKRVELAQTALLQVEKVQDLKCLSNLSCMVSNTYTYSVSHSNINNTIDNQLSALKQEADDANDISENYDNPSVESDIYVEENDNIHFPPKEIKQEADTNNTGYQNADMPSAESNVCIENNTIKKERIPKTHVLKKEIRRERKINNKKVKNLPQVRKRKKIVNTLENKEYIDIKDKFIEVEFTEEEMMKGREEKRSHPNFKKLPYNCNSCVLGFTRKETYEFHKEKKHNASIGPHTCPVCQVCFASSTTLTKHVKKHYHCYRCKMCTYETSELWSALSHSRGKHSGDSEHRIHCRACSYVAKSREDLAEHVKSQHTLICKECGEKFKGPNTLRTHKRRIHATVREHRCESCPRTFRSRGRLESHMTSHGPAAAARLAYCAVCRVQYKNIYVYRNHLVNSANHSERRYHCEECGKNFASKVYYKRHYTFYHQKESNYKCELCDRLFISDWRLRNHRQMRHGAERLRNHACDQCPKKFYTTSTLRAHQLTHSSQRSFMCADCGDTFKQRPALYTHTRLVHRGLKRRPT